jgi:hypothetical protein
MNTSKELDKALDLLLREAPPTPEPNPMPNTALSFRQHGDKAWSESTMLQAEMHSIYKRAKSLEHQAIVAWAKAEVLELAKASGQPDELTDAMIMAGVGELAKDHPTNAALVEAIYLAMTAAKP